MTETSATFLMATVDDYEWAYCVAIILLRQFASRQIQYRQNSKITSSILRFSSFPDCLFIYDAFGA